MEVVPTDDNVQMLLAMGFPSESEVRRALKLAKNDMNEAVDMLTTGQSLGTFDTQHSPGTSSSAQEISTMEVTDTSDFPAANFFELEGRVYTDSWSIPYREDESLAKCMFAAIKLLSEGRAGADELCSKFLNNCLPESFRKLLNSQAIYRWSTEIQEGVYDMVLILMELVATALVFPSKGEDTYIPTILLETLALSFSPDCEYHQKNKSMRTKCEHWEEKMGAERVICYPGKTHLGMKEFNWLANLVNKFHYQGGMEMIANTIELPKTNISAMAALAEPIAMCVEFLAPDIARPMFEKSIKRILHTVSHLGPDEFRDKNIGKACDLLRHVKVIQYYLWKKQVETADEKRLDLVLRMIKCPHFNAKMNALIEITKMLEDATADRDKGVIPLDKLTQWMSDNELLSIILSGSIDQAQYCEKVKRIVEHVAPHLSREDLEKLWNRTNDQPNHVVNNIHGIFAAAASQFSLDQFAAFTQLITENWTCEKEDMQHKLISLIGLIGRETKSTDLGQKVVELLWELSHREDMSRELVDMALDEVYRVMVDSQGIKDSYKKKYLDRCLDSIKKGVWIIPALQQLLSIVKNVVKVATNRVERGKVLSDIQKNHDVNKLVISSLISCHHMSVKVAADKRVELHPQLLVDQRYTHQEYVEMHLQCLQFVLQESNSSSLNWNRVRDLWDSMVSKPEACEWDRSTCYSWLTERINELDSEAACNLFNKKLVADHSYKLSSQGFECWKAFFNFVNRHEGRMKADQHIVDKTDLVGLEELWALCLNIIDPEIAQQAIAFLLHNIYVNLAPKHKRDPASLHRKFITECRRRLEALLISLRGGGSVVYRSLSQALFTLTAPLVQGLEKLPAPLRPKYAMNIERLLQLVEQYVLIVEELYEQPRSSLPHGSSFYGSAISITCDYETRKEQFVIMSHRNESLQSLRGQIADHMHTLPEHVQFIRTDLKRSKDQRLLCQLGIDNGHKIAFRLSYLASTSAGLSQQSTSATALPAVSDGAIAATSSPCKPGTWEMEKNLPGVMIAHESQVFKLLYQLAELGEPTITQRVVALLHLIPTDPAVVAIVDNMTATSGSEVESQPASQVNTPSSSPTHSPVKVRHATGSTYGSQSSMLSRKSSSSSSKLSSLFNRTGTGGKETSPFRVRYNLEVLSSRVMPVDMSSARPTQFCEDFLAGNGLSFILQVFQVDYFPADVEPDVRQACYSLSLQLISYLLCGETVTGSRGAPGPSSTQCIQKMEIGEFTDMLSCMMRVSWAASVGKHQLSNSVQPTRDISAYGRLRQNSADSTTSSNSDTDITCLYDGVCLTQTNVDDIDSSIAVKAFEIMILCLCARPELIGYFYTLPCVADFLRDVLTGCCREEVRTCAVTSLTNLSAIGNVPANIEHPKNYLLKLMLAARLPFWVTSCSTRGVKQRLLSQCLQYFDLRCALLMNLSASEQEQLNVDVKRLLGDEVAWLCNFQPSCKRVSELSTDDILLTGHLRLVRCLLTCEGVMRNEHLSLIHTLLDDFLFPAAKLENSADRHDSLSDFSPKCMVALTQSAAYDVLIEMCKDNLPAMQAVVTKLISWHHNRVETNEWEYMPPVEGRASSGFVGLKNGGATCYMNSVVQQLFMIPGIADSVLAIDEDDPAGAQTVFYEIQKVFGHLLHSQLQYYEPDQLWHVFQLWGQSVNVREQQDAFDFFTSLTDQLDETLKRLKRPQIFQNRFQGVFIDQKHCQDCPHKYEREEPFLALNLTVSNPSLEQSLNQFVKGELLEGDNAYFCEKCNLKRNAVKRMCIKSLPSVLCIHLKRFSFDWEANKALKFDDYFKFPLVLDMGPYTAEERPARYELVGMVVHTGQASAGHYYSFIKDRRGSAMSNESYGKWFKFNDTTVEEFEMTDEAMATECFGGKYKAKNTDSVSGKLPEDRVRYWNAYLLFYERIATPRSTGNRRSSRRKVASRLSQDVRPDSLSELSDLVHQGERQGAFSSRVPGWVQRSTRVDNLQFLRNRNVYSEPYFQFVRNLVSTESAHPETLHLQIQTALKFILNTYLRTKETLRNDADSWCHWFKQAFHKCPQVISWFIEYITDDPHTYIVPYFLTCCIKDIREFYLKLLNCAVDEYVVYLQSEGKPMTMLDPLIETLLALLNREVIEHCKNAYEYFDFFYKYSEMSDLTCDHLVTQDVISQFIHFLLGKVPENCTLENLPRRFTTLQTREFGPLHCTVAVLLLHLDFKSCADGADMESEEVFPSIRLPPNPLLPVNEDTANMLSDGYCQFYIREALIALKEMDCLVVVDGLVYTSHKLTHFSQTLIHQLRQQFTTSPGNELKGLTNLTVQLLLLADQSQRDRMQALISENSNGILCVIRDSQSSDSQKSYQLIKSLTSASSKSDTVSQYLLSCKSNWQWCVDWLKRKMEEQTWMSQTTMSNEASLSRNFQRTTSAQSTLDKATAMFTLSQGSCSDMEVDSVNSEELQIVPSSALPMQPPAPVD